MPGFGPGPQPTLTVEEEDGSPTVTGVREIKVSNGTLTDDGSGVVSINTAGSAGIGGSTGAVDNAVLRADGTGGSTVQPSPVIIADTTGAISGTQLITVQKDAIGTTSTDGLVIQNTTPAANGAQQYSPRLLLKGQGFRSSGSLSWSTDWAAEVRSVQGTTTPQAELNLYPQLNGTPGAVQLKLNSVTGPAFSTLTNNGFLKTSGAAGQLSVDTNVYPTNGAGVNSVPKSDGANLVASQITDDGTAVAVGTSGSAVTVAGNIVPKSYVALLTQSGTDAPVATVLNNTLGGTVVWTRLGTGQYEGTLAGAFTVSKTICLAGLQDVADSGLFVTMQGADVNKVILTQYDILANPTDTGNFAVQCFVYP